MKPSLKIALAIFVGLVAGSAITECAWRFYFQPIREIQQLSLRLNALKEAETAYFKSSPEIAELEITKLLPYLDTPFSIVRGDAQDQSFNRFVAMARLAKVQQAQGKQAEAKQNFEKAVRLLRAMDPKVKVDSPDGVLAMLGAIDDVAKKSLAKSAGP